MTEPCDSPQDALTRAQAQVSSQQQRRGSGEGSGGRVELLTRHALEGRPREKKEARELNRVMATHALQRHECRMLKKRKLEGCAAEQSKQLQEEMGKYSRLRQLVAKCDERQHGR